MTEKITLELTLKELQLLDKYVEFDYDTKSLINKIQNAYPKPKMIVENQGDFEIVSYNDSIYYNLHYPTGSHWFLKNDGNLEHITDKETIRLLDDAWFKDYNEVVELAKPAEEVFDRLEDKYKKAEENSASYITDENGNLDTFKILEIIMDLQDRVEDLEIGCVMKEYYD